MNTGSRFLEKRDFAVVLVSTVLTYLVSLAAECEAAFTGESVRELGMLVDGCFQNSCHQRLEVRLIRAVK